MREALYLRSKPLTKTDLKHFISWAEKQPRNGTYTFIDNMNCLIAQYLRACGFSRVTVTTSNFWTDKSEGRLPFELNEIAQGQPRTFGGATRRAKSLLKKI